jgi:hypothetical protein
MASGEALRIVVTLEPTLDGDDALITEISWRDPTRTAD